MQTLSPPDQQNNPPKASRKLPRWLLVAVLLLALSAIFYLPAQLNDYGKINYSEPKYTPIGRLFPFTVQSFPGNEDYQFFWEWASAGQMLDNRDQLDLPATGNPDKSRQVPLWRFDVRDGGRPLLAISHAPILYPFSILYYLSSGFTPFSIFHLWIALCGICLLSLKIPKGKTRWLVLAVGFALVLGLLPGLRPDFRAAFAWIPLALWLPLVKRRYVKLIGVAAVIGLMLLAVDMPTSLVMAGAVTLWLWLVEEQREGWKARTLLKSTTLTLITLTLGLFLAGPQLFPRMVYQEQNFTVPTAGYKPVLQAAPGVTLSGEVRISNTESRFTLTLPAKTTGQIHLTVPERYDSGWMAQFSLPDAPKKYTDAKLDKTAEGWRLITLDPPAGATTLTVRMRYNPLSFTLGLYATFFSLATGALVLVVLGWVRFYKEDENAHPLRRIVKNSVTPMFAQLAGKVIDFGFAFISLRLLGPEGNGRYTFAVTTWLFFNTLSDFGLETLVTREVARSRTTENANRYFSTMLVTRMTLAAISLPAALVWVGGFSLSGNIAPEVVWAIALLMIGMLPSAVSGTMSAVFRGYEKFEYLAALQILGSILKVPLGLGALLLGWNVIGLAGTSIVVNVVAMSILLSIFRRELFQPEVRKGFDRTLVKPMLSAAFPLMLNGLLISIMFKSDVFLLQPFKGDNEVGLYNAAYKFVDALLIFPTAITMALFPIFSSYSANARENMTRAFAEGMRLLAIIGLPICGGIVFVAYDLIGLLGGESFLPGGAIALQILIWFLPFSYINGITQYVLIALNRQRYITIAVLITAASNIILNLIFIPFFGYIAASAMTIGTEVILLTIYAVIMRRINEPFPVLQAMLRPTAATAAMVAVLFGVTVGLKINNFFITVILGVIVYLVGLVVFRAVTKEDVSYIRKILKR